MRNKAPPSRAVLAAGVAEGKRTAADVDQMFAKMNGCCGLAIEVEDRTHAVVRRSAGAASLYRDLACRSIIVTISIPRVAFMSAMDHRTPATRSARGSPTVLHEIFDVSLVAQAFRDGVRGGRKPGRGDPSLRRSHVLGGGGEMWLEGRRCCMLLQAATLGQKSVKSQALLCRVHPAIARWVPSGDGSAVTGVP